MELIFLFYESIFCWNVYFLYYFSLPCSEGAEYECPTDEQFQQKNGKLCMSLSLACDGLPNCGENIIPNADEACFKVTTSDHHRGQYFSDIRNKNKILRLPNIPPPCIIIHYWHECYRWWAIYNLLVFRSTGPPCCSASSPTSCWPSRCFSACPASPGSLSSGPSGQAKYFAGNSKENYTKNRIKRKNFNGVVLLYIIFHCSWLIHAVWLCQVLYGGDARELGALPLQVFIVCIKAI